MYKGERKFVKSNQKTGECFGEYDEDFNLFSLIDDIPKIRYTECSGNDESLVGTSDKVFA